MSSHSGSTRSSVVLAVLSTLAGGGCTVGPDYEVPELEAPSEWRSVGGLEQSELQDLSRWWTLFEDPVLDQIVERAIQGNLDLRSALYRIDALRAQRGVAASELYPQIDADGAYRWNYSGRSAFGFGAFQRRLETYNAAIGGSWELDVFGRVRRGIESAEAEIGASLEDYRGVLVAIVAEVGRNYILVRSFEERLQIAEENLANQSDTLELTRARAEGGLAPELDVALAATNVGTTRASIPLLRQGLLEAKNRLAILVGSPPGDLEALLAESSSLPKRTTLTALDLPLNVLLRRPDVRRAERLLAAQSARIGIADSEHYPRFFAVSSFGIASSNASVLDTRALQFSVGPSISWNLFSGGRIDSDVAAQKALFEAARRDLEQVALLALEEVENALGGVRNETARAEALLEAVDAAGRARDQSRSLYVGGLADFDSVLSAEQLRLQSEDLLKVGETNVLLELIDLYSALGGGWSLETRSPEEEDLEGVRAFASSEPEPAAGEAAAAGS